MGAIASELEWAIDRRRSRARITVDVRHQCGAIHETRTHRQRCWVGPSVRSVVYLGLAPVLHENIDGMAVAVGVQTPLASAVLAAYVPVRRATSGVRSAWLAIRAQSTKRSGLPNYIEPTELVLVCLPRRFGQQLISELSSLHDNDRRQQHQHSNREARQYA